MRFVFLLTTLACFGCSSAGPTTAALCDFCSDDSQCGGNPCFQDASGGRFCGAPCDSCPSGFSCQTLSGTRGLAKTCFPDAQVCPAGGAGSFDAGDNRGNGDGGTSMDLAVPRSTGGDAAVPFMCTKPKGGTVSITGGTVDRLYFGYTGDTRDTSSGSGYSSQLLTIISNIYSQMGKQGVSFALDGGDHMEASNFSEAQACMSDYASAAAMLGKPLFMTMGNHECSQSFNMGSSCGYGAWMTDSKGSAYIAALKQISGATLPYYRFDVQTHGGKAVFLVVADDAWDPTQEAWLTQQLTDADANAKYTFVSKHHPDGNQDQTYFQTIYNLVKQHKYTLFLNGHSHEYKHQYNDNRAVVMGLGGAPFDNPNQMWWGYLTVMQCEDDSISVAVFDQATGNIKDSFSVPPQ